MAGDYYQFYVTATNGRGESLPSSTISVYAATVPSPPESLLRSSTTTQYSITFTWSVPSTNGGSPVTDYSVYWDEGADNNLYKLIETSTGNALSYT